jgi:hypothetical protein
MTDEQQRQIARINELSAIARTSWLALLAFLAYIGITLLAVEDADFFVPSRQTSCPSSASRSPLSPSSSSPRSSPPRSTSTCTSTC